MELQYSDVELIKKIPNFSNHFAVVNDTTLHYVSGGHGEPLLLIPGYPETWWAYHKVMPILAEKYHVIVVEMRGMGSSDKPESGYDKKNMAKDIHELIKILNFETVNIAGHDIGAHVAFSFASNYPDFISKLILLDTPHPDAGMYKLPMLPIPGSHYTYPWWLAFNQVKDLPEQLLDGRMSIIISWLFDHLIVDKKAITDFDKAIYTQAYDSKEAIRASNSWYQAFPQDISDYSTYNKIEIPVLGIGGSGYNLLENVLPQIANNLQLQKINDCGHFLLAEKPNETADFIIKFIG
ncbi:alpha/beta fold hydrolase [Chryseobacterium sp. Mn2064]|uniref:alpha/beta fold hydrolase n=1 Tax=Chryseobacterium sp. Mn2064 TaxID=3395263 RepID=UPI003BE5B042